MGSFSVMHWLIILFPVLVIAAVLKFTRSSTTSLGRGGFALRVVAVVAANLVLQEIMGVIAREYYNFGTLVVIDLIGVAVSMVLIAYWAVSRLRDMGKSPNNAFFMAVPLVGGFYVLFLMFAKAVQRPSGQIQTESSLKV